MVSAIVCVDLHASRVVAVLISVVSSASCLADLYAPLLALAAAAARGERHKHAVDIGNGQWIVLSEGKG